MMTMNRMTTRRRRECLIREAELELNNMNCDLVNDTVIELAVNIRGTLSVISDKFTNDAIIDIIPDVVGILNKLDTTISYNNELLNERTDLLNNNTELTKQVEYEKNKRKENFEDSLFNEEKAEEEILLLEARIKKLEASNTHLNEELNNKNEIIKIIEADNNSLFFNRDTILDKVTSRSNDEFITPRNTAKVRTDFTETGAITVNNRFEILSENAKSASNNRPTTSHKLLVKAQVHRPIALPKTSHIKNTITETTHTGKKRRMTILSDSQGKHLSEYLQHLYDSFETFVYTKPGAKLKHIIQDGMDFVKDFTKDDVIVILAGTNDFHVDEPHQLTVFQGINALLKLRLKSKIVVCSVPYRYDNLSLNENILFSNSYLSRVVSEYEGGLRLSFLDVNDFLQRSHFTRHGLHLNRRGKLILARNFEVFAKQNAARIGVGDLDLSANTGGRATTADELRIPQLPESPAINYLGSYPITPNQEEMENCDDGCENCENVHDSMSSEKDNGLSRTSPLSNSLIELPRSSSLVNFKINNSSFL
ncbi:uncharacterized protein LOC111046414 [Nilaparvata lugens]|uniref:uncharacterized protein LOC111046414 n=1 Tax=Nilaparvata lugens TaxID=108931 RepID=UPI00193E5140|nr:uncharacterized protein LOC111046414 [Nilaparvata lugens]